MNDELTIVLFLALALQVVFLYYFFKLCADVTKIKSQLSQTGGDNYSQYQKHKAFGNRAEAKAALETFIWNKVLLIRSEKATDQQKKDYYNEFRSKHEPRLIDLGGVWPDFKV